MHRLLVLPLFVALLLTASPTATADHAGDRIRPPAPEWIEALEFTPGIIDASFDTSEPIEVGFALKVATTCADFHFEAECDSWTFGIRSIELYSPSERQVARGSFKFTSGGHASSSVTFPADPEPGAWRVVLLDMGAGPSSTGGFAYTDVVPAGTPGGPWEIVNFPDTEAVQTAVVVLVACDGCGQDDLVAQTRPTVTGEPLVGATLTGVPATFNDGTVTNQWLADGAPIAGATGTELSLGEDLEGAVITFRSTATRGDETLDSLSEAVGPVQPADEPDEPGAPDESDLTEATENLITVLPAPTITLGDRFRIEVGVERAGRPVRVVLFSDPIGLGTPTVDDAGQVAVTLPSDVPAGEHRLAVYDDDGELIGWQSVTVRAASTSTGTPADTSGQAGPGGQAGAGHPVLPAVGAAVPAPLAVAGLLMLVAGAALLLAPRRGRRPLSSALVAAVLLAASAACGGPAAEDISGSADTAAADGATPAGATPGSALPEGFPAGRVTLPSGLEIDQALQEDVGAQGGWVVTGTVDRPRAAVRDELVTAHGEPDRTSGDVSAASTQPVFLAWTDRGGHSVAYTLSQAVDGRTVVNVVVQEFAG